MNDINRTKVLAKADQVAARHLRQKYAEEFNRVKQEYAASEGVEWSPRLTGAEKARAEVARLLRDNPEVRAELVAEIERQVLAPDEG